MSLFVRKDLGSLLAEAGAGTLRRELGPLALVTLGIGAVIGAGIFVLSGTVASQNAGPALTLSMVFAGIACVFAGLCYAELASMIPVAGSAYTYAYATMGGMVGIRRHTAQRDRDQDSAKPHRSAGSAYLPARRNPRHRSVQPSRDDNL